MKQTEHYITIKEDEMIAASEKVEKAFFNSAQEADERDWLQSPQPKKIPNKCSILIDYVKTFFRSYAKKSKHINHQVVFYNKSEIYGWIEKTRIKKNIFPKFIQKSPENSSLISLQTNRKKNQG